MSNGIGSKPALAFAGASVPAAANRTTELLEAAIFPTLLRLSTPNVLNLAAIAGLVTFDALFLGRLGAEALAGVSLVFPFVMFVQHVAASGVGGAVSSAVARALGAGARERANDLAAHAFALAVGMAIVISGVMLPLGAQVYRWMGGQGAMLDAALAYSTAVFGGAISICMLNILANVVRGTGNMIYPAMVLVGSVLAHVVISPLLIFGCGPVPPLGPAGAGWGLALSFGIGSVVLFFHLRGGNSPVKLDFSRLPRQWALYQEFFKVGIPGLLNVALNNLAVIVLTGVAGHLGREAAIGYAMGARLEYIMIPLAFGFGTAMVTMVGTNWGAKQRQRARAIAWTGAGTVAAACGIVGVFFALFPSVWIGIFTDEDEVIRVGTLYLQTVGPMYALCGAGMAIYFAMQGTGNPMPAVLANAFRLAVSAGGALVAVSWLGAGPLGLFIAIGSGFVVYGGLNAYLLARR